MEDVRVKRYNDATDKLIAQVESVGLPYGFRKTYNMTSMMYMFRLAFCEPLIRNAILAPVYERERIESGRYSAGFCSVASYTWSQLFRWSNGEEFWRLKAYSGNRSVLGLTDHVWLENAVDGQILDITFDQSIDGRGNILEIPYHLGQTVGSNFEYPRANTFAALMGIDLQHVFIDNMFRRALSKQL